MKLHIYKEIERRIESIQNWTNMRVGLKNETWEFQHLNSLYISHRQAELMAGHGIEDLIILNDHYLYVYDMHNVALIGNICAVPLPTYHVMPIFQRVGFPLTIPYFLKTFDTVMVGYPDFFSGFDDDGKPIFWLRNVTVKVGDREIFCHVGRLDKFLNDPDTLWEKIGCQRVAFNPRTGQAYYQNKLYDPYCDWIEIPTAEVERCRNEIDAFLNPLGYDLTCAYPNPCEEYRRCKSCEYNGKWWVVKQSLFNNCIGV